MSAYSNKYQVWITYKGKRFLFSTHRTRKAAELTAKNASRDEFRPEVVEVPKSDNSKPLF